MILTNYWEGGGWRYEWGYVCPQKQILSVWYSVWQLVRKESLQLGQLMTFKSSIFVQSLLVSIHAVSATKNILEHLQSALPNILPQGQMGKIWKLTTYAWLKIRHLKSYHHSHWIPMKTGVPLLLAHSQMISTPTIVLGLHMLYQRKVSPARSASYPVCNTVVNIALHLDAQLLSVLYLPKEISKSLTFDWCHRWCLSCFEGHLPI